MADVVRADDSAKADNAAADMASSAFLSEVNNYAGSKDSGNSFLDRVNGKPGAASHEDKPETSEPPEGLVVVCGGNTCVPFSIENSGDNDAATFVKDNFRTFDRNNNGFVTSDEARYWRNKFEKNSPAQKMSDRIIAGGQSVADLSNDELGAENDGITIKDLERVLAIADKSPKSLSQAEKNLLHSLDWKAQERRRSRGGK